MNAKYHDCLEHTCYFNLRGTCTCFCKERKEGNYFFSSKISLSKTHRILYKIALLEEFEIEFQSDGSICVTGGLDSFGRFNLNPLQSTQ